MYKTFVAGVTALSLTLAPAPAMARGNDAEQLGGIIVGLAVLGIIGKAIHDNNTRARVPAQNQPRAQQHQPQSQPLNRNTYDIRPQAPTGLTPRQGTNNRWRDASVLPSACISRHDTQRGQQRIFGARCLNERYPYAANLPQECGVRLRTYDGPRRGYVPSCLRDHGYRSDRH